VARASRAASRAYRRSSTTSPTGCATSTAPSTLAVGPVRQQSHQPVLLRVRQPAVQDDLHTHPAPRLATKIDHRHSAYDSSIGPKTTYHLATTSILRLLSVLPTRSLLVLAEVAVFPARCTDHAISRWIMGQWVKLVIVIWSYGSKGHSQSSLVYMYGPTCLSVVD